MSDKLEHKHDLEMILNLVKSDAIAISYQSIKQYRENIIKELQLCLNLLSERMGSETSHDKALHKHFVNASFLPELNKFAASNFDTIAEMTKRITSGNVSHNANQIQGVAKRCSEFIRKHYW